MTARSTGEIVINSRLLVLQSKMLMLASLQRRAQDEARAARLEAEVGRTQHRYREAVLAWGRPENSDYWIVAYSRLIEVGNALLSKLQEADLPPSDRVEASTDFESLETVVAGWRQALRDSMAKSAA